MLASQKRDAPENPVKIIAAVVVASLVGVQSGDAGTVKKTVSPYRAESSAHVTWGKDVWTYITENRSFRFVEVLNDEGQEADLLLLEETYHNERRADEEGMRGNASVKAWTLTPRGQRKLRWSFREVGNAGEAQGRLFRVAAWGCCDAPTIYSFYNLLSGKKLYVSNSNLLEVSGSGGGPQALRLVAFGYAQQGQLNQPPQLQYGTDKKIVQRCSVISSRPYYDAPEMFVSTDIKLEKSLNLIGSELTFIIVLRYVDGVELRIPVEADTVRIEKAALPEGYSLRMEK
jgi:hypothetical protein